MTRTAPAAKPTTIPVDALVSVQGGTKRQTDPETEAWIREIVGLLRQ
jgi:hypothetical protein